MSRRASFSLSPSSIRPRLSGVWKSMKGLQSPEQRRKKRNSANDNEISAELVYNRFENIELTAGVKAGTYVNNFMVAYNDLNAIAGHEMGEEEAKILFLQKIRDPELGPLREVLKIEMSNRSLQDIANAVNKAETRRGIYQ